MVSDLLNRGIRGAFFLFLESAGEILFRMMSDPPFSLLPPS